MARHDPVAQGRVQLLCCPKGDVPQAMAALDELVRLSTLDPEFDWAQTAIIAKEWRYLEPVRAYAETLGIPVELANEKPISLWRLREMQTLVSNLRTDPGRLMKSSDLLALLDNQPTNRWTDLIGEGVKTLGRELGTSSMPALDAVEWLAEWARDTRGNQRSLLLLTVHRAKGLEFDHVILLDGGWDRISRKEDADAPRRLFYVGMTRARKSLAVMATGKHRFLEAESTHVLRRVVYVEPGTVLPRRSHYMLPDYKAVDLSYPGREGYAVRNAVSSAQVGDRIKLVCGDKHWELRDRLGRPLGRMEQTWQPPVGMVLARGIVGAVVRWRKSDSKETFKKWIQTEEWETILPEFEFVEGTPNRDK